MKAPTIYIVMKNGEPLEWWFDEIEANARCEELNLTGFAYSHRVEECKAGSPMSATSRTW